MLENYLWACFAIFIISWGFALWDDFVVFKHDPEKNNWEYAKSHASEYCMQNYKNPVAHSTILLISLPIVNLLMLAIVIVLSIMVVIALSNS